MAVNGADQFPGASRSGPVADPATGRELFDSTMLKTIGSSTYSRSTSRSLADGCWRQSLLAQSARRLPTDAPRRWNVDERALVQIDGELARLASEIARRPARARIAAIRDLLADSVLEAMPRPEAEYALTRRELDVLGWVAEGCSNAEAAQRLGVSPETVKAYLRNIHGKLGVRNRTEAVAVARRSGLLP
jgi:DNA-binding CsgD family transcriptional regulator